MGPLHFWARCRSRRLNLALVFFLVYFVLLYISFDWWIRAFVVLGLVLPYQGKRLARGTSPKWRILCRVGRKTLTRSISVHYWLGNSSVSILYNTCANCAQRLSSGAGGGVEPSVAAGIAGSHGKRSLKQRWWQSEDTPARQTTCLENLEMWGTFKDVRESHGIVSEKK